MLTYVCYLDVIPIKPPPKALTTSPQSTPKTALHHPQLSEFSANDFITNVYRMDNTKSNSVPTTLPTDVVDYYSVSPPIHSKQSEIRPNPTAENEIMADPLLSNRFIFDFLSFSYMNLTH